MSPISNALVIMWMGKDMPKEVIEEIAAIMADKGIAIPEMIVMSKFGYEDIAKAVVGKASKKMEVQIPDTTTKALESALLLISNKFEEVLKDKSNLLFAISLSKALSKALQNRYLEESEALINAVDIITSFDRISESCLRKYHISRSALSVIHSIKSNYC